ncbi:MAG TPA: preprotein translocase subunit SecG [Fibrobacteria bacterium]|nr:preprotein translocase subunit SecG [Fibrobacteria bacterium]
MQFLYIALIVLHVILCLFLVLLILLQNDKGGGLAGAFGGMGGSAAFTGSSTATFLTKITWGLAAVSFALILGLNALAMSGNNATQRESELKSARKGLSSVLPAAPAAGAPGGAPQGIPGLGTAPAAAPQEQAPATAPSAPTEPAGPAGAPAGGAGSQAR